MSAPLEGRDRACARDMLDAARAIAAFGRVQTLESYCSNRMLRGAVERHLEMIGEAAAHVSPDGRQAHPEIPWQQIIAQRNLIIHECGAIDDTLAWRVVTERLPPLIESLARIVPPAP